MDLAGEIKLSRLSVQFDFITSYNPTSFSCMSGVAEKRNYGAIIIILDELVPVQKPIRHYLF